MAKLCTNVKKKKALNPKRFKRADESRNTEGSGLGLAIARDLVSLQGGNMSIDIDGDLFKVKVVMDEYPQQILLQK